MIGLLRSMTGYGRAQFQLADKNILLEIKSVNHRYFEFSSRVPRAFGFLEEKLKSFFQGSISRGKVECFLQIEFLADDDVQIQINHALAGGYVDAMRELSERYNLMNDLSAVALGQFPDLFHVEKKQVDPDALWADVLPAAQQALTQFLSMRESEGERLRLDVESRLDTILNDVAFVEARSPETVQEYNEKLLGRMRDLLESATVDEQRLLTEAAIFADKIAVAEETVRLRSHMDQLRGFLGGSEEAIGRKMDFLVQEMNREANTIGSKAQDVAIARRVVNVKSEIEKIREQIQNIE